jgi:DHA1 family bicyclomycin/chloramphenicol resistance-like MFS transporter
MPSPALDSAPVARSVFGISERELVFMLAMTQALQALAIDAMLPGLADIARDLAVTDPNRRQLVVGIFLIGIGIGSIVPGLLADRFGRRRVLLGCLGGYVLLTAACALVTEFNMMVALRLIAGMACAGLGVLPSAIIRDRFEGDQMAKLQSLVGVIFMIVPMLAPSIGQLIMLIAGWRWIFGFMAVFGAGIATWVALRLPETLHPGHRQEINLRSIAANMSITLTTRAATGYVLASAAVMGVMWGYIQCCQQLLSEHFGAGRAFPLLFGGMALSMAVANFGNARIVERFGARRVSHAALLAYIAVSALQVWMAHLPHQSLWQFVPVMTANMMLMGFMGANFGSIALQPFARIAGAASSVQAFIRLVLGSLIGAVVGQAYDQTARPLAFALLMGGLVSLILVLYSERGTLFRRLYPPGAVRPV